MEKAKIEVRNLNLYYGSFHALKNITMEIKEERITAVIGPSGCGKSSFIRCLNRMNDLIEGTKVEGEVYIDGVNIYERDVDVVALRKKSWHGLSKAQSFSHEYL